MSATILSLKRLSAPTSEPVTLEEAKAFARIDHAVEDSLMSNLIISARQMAEQYLHMSLLPQQHEALMMLDWEQSIELPYGPISVIDSVATLDANNTITLVNEAHYALGARPDTMHLMLSLAGQTLRIRYSAGYALPADVPMAIRHGIMLHVTELYEERIAPSSGIPAQAQALYAPFRRVGGL